MKHLMVEALPNGWATSACGRAVESFTNRPSLVDCGGCARSRLFRTAVIAEARIVASNMAAIRRASRDATFAVMTGLSNLPLCGRCGMARCEHATLRSVSS